MNTITIDSQIFEKTLNFMDTIVADSYNIVIPADEDGREARSEKYMKWLFLLIQMWKYILSILIILDL